MNKDQLLKHAKENYPAGTVVAPVRTPTGDLSKNQYTIGQDAHYTWHDDHNGVICAPPNIYVNGFWAKIISKPEITINSFEIW
jgi:hypothetical protein